MNNIVTVSVNNLLESIVIQNFCFKKGFRWNCSANGEHKHILGINSGVLVLNMDDKYIQVNNEHKGDVVNFVNLKRILKRK